ncbi:hypothetical protein [Georgenia sp. 311]|nr:hypothetical protein [Georgenia sp. 311]
MGPEQDADQVTGMGGSALWRLTVMAQQAALQGRLRELIAVDDGIGEAL